MPHGSTISWPRNSACYCGSGLKYKRCCYAVASPLVEGADGSICHSIPMTPEMAQMLRTVIAEREQELGRPLRGDERIFPDMDEQTVKEATVQMLVRANIPPRKIFCYLRTDRLVTEENRDFVPASGLAEWEEAGAEYDVALMLGENPFDGYTIPGVDLSSLVYA